MPTADELKIIFRTEAQKAIKDMQEVRRQSDEAAGGFDGLSSNAIQLAAAGAGLSIALKGVYSAISQNIDVYAVQEGADKKLEAVLRATGEAAGFNASELKKMASDLQNVTTIGDETTESAMAVLLTFKQIKDQNFERAIKSTQDLSHLFGDTKSSATMLGKALEDPARGLTALRRVGVSFTEEQEKMIKSFAETEKLAEAQSIVLDVLEGQVGGVAKAMRDAATGDIEALKNSFGDLKEASGEAAAYGIRPVVVWLEKVISAAAETGKQFNKLDQALNGDIDVDDDVLETQKKLVAELRAEYEKLEGADEGLLRTAQEMIDEQEAILQQLIRKQEVVEELGMLELKQGRAAMERAAARRRELQEEYEQYQRIEEEQQKRLSNQELLDSLYSATDQGRIDALEEQLDKLDRIQWSEFNLEKVGNVRAALLEKINKLKEKESETDEKKVEDQSLLNQLLDEQAERVKKLADAQEALRQVEFMIYAAQLEGDKKRIANLIEIREEIQKIIEGMEGDGDQDWDFQGLADRIKSELGDATGYIASTLIEAFGGDARLWGEIGDALMDGLDGTLQILGDTLGDELGQALSDALEDAVGVAESLGGYFKVAAAVVKIFKTIYDAFDTSDIEVVVPDFGILDAEENLAEARIELIRATIREEERMRDEALSKLEADYNREYQILKDMLDRNLIDHQEFADRAEELYSGYESQSSIVNDAADAAIQEEEAKIELENAKKETRDDIEAAIEKMKDELDDMGWFKKLFSGKDEELEGAIKNLELLLGSLDRATTIDELEAMVTPYSNKGSIPNIPRTAIQSQPSIKIDVSGNVYGIDDLHAQLEAAGDRLAQRAR